MRIAPRFLLACLLSLPLVPAPAGAGGGMREDPYEIGRKLLAGKHYKTARVYFQQALRRNDVRAHYGLGLVSEGTGRDRDALRHYQLLLGLDHPDAQRGEISERVRAIEERLKKKPPARAPSSLERGRALLKKGKYREAERVLLEGARRGGPAPEVHFSLGEVYLKLEQYGKAKAEFDKAKKAF